MNMVLKEDFNEEVKKKTMAKSKVVRMDNVGIVVESLDETLSRLQKIGAQLVGEVVKYEDVYRLCYIRGPEGLLIGLAEQLSTNRNPL